MLFFFFKQKTAYEMRISDWSSDVCSSDLPGIGFVKLGAFVAVAPLGEEIDELAPFRRPGGGVVRRQRHHRRESVVEAHAQFPNSRNAVLPESRICRRYPPAEGRGSRNWSALQYGTPRRANRRGAGNSRRPYRTV